MNDQDPIPSPVHGEKAGRTDVARRGFFSEPAPIVCPECDTSVVHGMRFCPSCRSFLPVPHVGRLATAKRRLGAAWIDSIVRDGGLLGSAVGPLFMPSGVAGTLVVVTSTLYWASSLYMWTRGTTPAKRLFNMKVVTADGEPAGFMRMAFRETIGKMISYMVFGMGVLTIPGDKEKQGWHDKMVDTWVVVDDDD